MTDPLPPGWALTKVGKICKVEYGKGLSKKQRVETGEVEVFGSAGFSGYHDTSLVDEPIVIVGRKGNAGRVWVTQGPSWPIDTTYFLRPPHAISPKYLSLQLGHLDLVEKDSSTTIPSLRRPDLEATQINLAPLVEQQRIVAAIEEHFSRIDTAESAAQTALARLDTLRRAILTAAFSGHLVEPLNPRRTPDGLPEDWKLHTLDEIMHGSLFSDGDWVESKDQDPSGSVRLIQLADIGEGVFRDRSNRWLNEPTAERLGCTYLHKDDVLIARMPDPIGRTCLMPYLESLSVTAVDVCILRPNPNSLFAPWLMWRINSPSFRIRVEALQSGTTRKRISRKNLSTISIALPPLEDQKQIVAVIEERFSRINAAKASLERCLQRCGILRRAVLATAFSGRLVEQDPSDEPASVLLERIAAEQPKRRTQRRSA